MQPAKVNLSQFLKIIYCLLDTFLNINMCINIQVKAEYDSLLKKEV